MEMRVNSRAAQAQTLTYLNNGLTLLMKGMNLPIMFLLLLKH